MNVKIGRWVRLIGFAPGHGLYRAEGSVEGYIPAVSWNPEDPMPEEKLAQVLLGGRSSLTLRGKLVHVEPSHLEPHRKPRERR